MNTELFAPLTQPVRPSSSQAAGAERQQERQKEGTAPAAGLTRTLLSSKKLAARAATATEPYRWPTWMGIWHLLLSLSGSRHREARVLAPSSLDPLLRSTRRRARRLQSKPGGPARVRTGGFERDADASETVH